MTIVAVKAGSVARGKRSDPAIWFPGLFGFPGIWFRQVTRGPDETDRYKRGGPAKSWRYRKGLHLKTQNIVHREPSDMRSLLDAILPLDLAAYMPMALGLASLGLALYAIR
jgi:hypothetical protein